MITTIIALGMLAAIWLIWKKGTPTSTGGSTGSSSNENPAPKPPKQK